MLETQNQSKRAQATVIVKVKLNSLVNNQAAILVGDIFWTENNIKFVCIEDVVLNQFVTNYPVKTMCVNPGEHGNVEANTIVKFSREYYESVNNPHPAWGGVDGQLSLNSI